MAELRSAVLGLRQALDAPLRQATWRWLVRHRLAAVTQALRDERSVADEAWLAARSGVVGREQHDLIERLGAFEARVATGAMIDIRLELFRILGDLEHHRQRMSDLAYDAVSLELGESG